MTERPSRRPVFDGRDRTPRIIGLPVFRGRMPDVIAAVGALIDAHRPHLVVTLNVDHAIDLAADTELVTAYRRASLRVIDGAPVLWVFRLLGARGIARVTGADLIDEATARARQQGWRIAVAGGSTATLQAAVRVLRERHPGTVIEPVDMPRLVDGHDPAGAIAVERLRAVAPSIVFLCLGAPKQETWFCHWHDQLPAAVYVGAGAAVDFAAGTRHRAPRVAQRLGLEWTWRLAQEFGRLAPRYLVKGPRLIGIVASSLAFAVRARLRHPAPRSHHG